MVISIMVIIYLFQYDILCMMDVLESSVSEYTHCELETALERHFHSYKDTKTSDMYKVTVLFRSML